MRVLFTVSSWPTHYAVLVPVGWALRAAGHDVRVLCAPSQAGPVCSAGLVPVPVLESLDVAVLNRLEYVAEARAGRWPYPWLPLHPLTGEVMTSLADFDVDRYRRDTLPGFVAASRRSADEALRFARLWKPDLVLHDPVSLEGPLVAQVCGLPAAVALWGPTGVHEPDVRVVPEDLGDVFGRHGVRTPPGCVANVIDPCPPAVAAPGPARRLAVRYIAYNGTGAPRPEVDRYRRTGRPRVCVTWSTALTRMSGPNSYALPAIVAALDALDVDVLLTATPEDARALGTVPPRVRVLERFPLHQLVSGCDVLVHHGGAGSTMTGLVSGVPQVAVTYATEQAVNAARLAATGAACHVPGWLATSDTIADAVVRILHDPGYRRAAQHLRTEATRRPTPADLVPVLQQLR